MRLAAVLEFAMEMREGVHAPIFAPSSRYSDPLHADQSAGRQHLHDTNGHGGALQQRGHHDADQHAHDGVAHTLHQFKKYRPFFQRFGGGAHQIHADEQNAQAHAHHARLLERFFFIEHHDHHDADKGEYRTGIELDGQQEGRNGGADVRAHDDADGLNQREQLGVHETHYHHRRRAGGLDDSGNAYACDQSDKAVPCHQGKKVFQFGPGGVFQAFAHGAHAEEEKGQAAQQRQYTLKIHTFLLCRFFRLARRLISRVIPV